MKERKDDFNTRSEHLKGMNDEELKSYFYELANKIIDPLLKLSYENTTKSIERSILLRMGFSSIEAKDIVDKLNEHNLLRKGAGHCLYKLAQKAEISIKEAGTKIMSEDGIDFLLEEFKS